MYIYKLIYVKTLKQKMLIIQGLSVNCLLRLHTNRPLTNGQLSPRCDKFAHFPVINERFI